MYNYITYALDSRIIVSRVLRYFRRYAPKLHTYNNASIFGYIKGFKLFFLNLNHDSNKTVCKEKHCTSHDTIKPLYAWVKNKFVSLPCFNPIVP